MKTIKKLIAAFLALLFVFSPLAGVPFELPVFAATSGTTGDCTWSLSGTTLTISGRGKMGNYGSGGPWGSSITKVIIEDGVTTIGEEAFYKCRNLTSVIIPDSVTSIGCLAFYYCDSLTSITIPDSVTSIGDVAFKSCSSLTSITIPDSVTSINYGAFVLCDSLTSVIISDSVTSIGDEAFHRCGSLTDLIIPDSVTTIGGSAFSFCSSLTSITIPDSVTSIGGCAFYSCSSLTSVTIPDSVTSIGEDAFSGCDNLATLSVASGNPVYHSNGNCIIETASKTLIQGCNNSTIPADGSVTSIGDEAFVLCGSLTSITIPDSVTSIGAYAFSSCSSLTSITIPDSVTSIGSYAFISCSSLTSVTIPDSVTSIGDGAFYNCSRLTDVWYEGSAEDRAKISIGSINEALTSAAWHYNTCKEHTYDNACDSDCNVCGNVRTTTHIYDNACDTDCNECGSVRNITHDYSVQDRNNINHWMKCCVCGAIDETTVTVHIYDYACDPDCNVCGEDRTPPHDYTVLDKDENYHWMKCSLCGRVDESSRTSHVYDHACDADCNLCGYDRTPYVFGDADGNEEITIDDALYVLFHTSFPEDYPVDQPVDYDGNGYVDMDDAVYLMFYVFFPDRFPLL